MKLRGHHIFCSTLFSGSGYDEKFTEKMGDLIKRMDEGEKISLVRGCDELCGSCPNLTEAGCELGDDDVLHRDNEALRVTGLSEGSTVCRQDLFERLTFVTKDDFISVCGNCRWMNMGLCTFELLQNRTKREGP